MQRLAKMMMGCAAAWTLTCAAAEPESWARSGKPVDTACVKATDLREVLLALKKQLKLPDAAPGRRARRRTPGTARLVFLPDGSVTVECAKGMYPTLDYKVSAYTPAEDSDEEAKDQEAKDQGDRGVAAEEGGEGQTAASEPRDEARVKTVEVCERELVMACKPMPMPKRKRKVKP